MKNIKRITIIVLVGIVYQAHAQYNTGDDDLNISLQTIDANAQLDFGAFKVDISGSYDITEKKLDYLSVEIGMSAGDIYMSVELAKTTEKSIDEVVTVYTTNKNKGWGVIAKELDIKPGSPEFHALKGKANDKGKAKDKGNKKSKGKGKSKSKN